MVVLDYDSCYKILRPVEQADFNAPPKIVQILKMIPSDGRVAFEHFKDTGKHTAIRESNMHVPTEYSKEYHRTSAY